jgi:hypothetical protein
MSKLGLSAGRPSESKKAQALKAVSEDKSQMVRVNFELDEAAHLKLKIYAAKERRSISEILRELIEKNIPVQN